MGNFKAKILAELDTSQFIKDINSLKKKYGNLEIKIDLSKALKDNQATSAGAKAGKAYSTAFLSQMKDKIQLKIDSGDFQTKIDAIVNKMQSLNQVSDITKANVNTLKSAFDVMGSNNSSIEEKIQAYQTFNLLLPTIRAQINLAATEEKQYAQSVRDAMQEQLTLSRSTTLSNDIQTWMNNNTRAAEQYGEELRELQSKLKNNTDASALNEVSVKFREIKSEARASGVAVSQFGLNFKQAITYALGIGSLTQVISKCIQVTKEMVETTIELDDAMAQLRIVTDATEKEYSQFKDKIFSISKDISASATDLIDSSTVYARLGYSLEDSQILAKYTAMLENVGDIDATSSQNALTAIFKAFDVNINDIEKVMDKLVEVGNNFPISVKELAEGINNAGSMMASAGNSYEETLSLLAAANTTVQDISKASTGLRTVAARIRNTKTELDELGEVMSEAEYDELVQGLTKYNVTLTDAQGNFRSTYDILKDLSNVWDDLSNIEQASIAKLLAGTRQQNVFYSIIGQFDEAKNAMNSMADSAGALQTAYDEYLNTTTAHMETFKTAFAELADTIVNGELLNFFIDFGTEAVEITTAITEFIDSIGGIRTILLAVVAALLLAKGGLIAYKLELIATAAIEKIITFFNSIKMAILNIVHIIPNAVAAWKAYAVGTASASTAMQASIPVIGLVLAGLTALSAGIALASSETEEGAEDTSAAIDETNQKIRQLANTAKDSTEQLSKLSLEYVNAKNNLDGLSSTTQNYTTATDNLRKGLKIEQSEVQALIDKYGDYDTALQKAALSKLQADEVDLRAGVKVAFGDLKDAHTVDYIGKSPMGSGIDLDNLSDEVLSEIQDAQKVLNNLSENNKLTFDYTLGIDDEDNTFNALLISAQDASDEMVDIYGFMEARIIQQYKTYQAALEELANAGLTDNYLYDQIEQSYLQIREPAEAVLSSVKSLNENLATQYILENNIGKELPKTKDEFEKYRDELVNGAVASNHFYGTQEDIKAAIDDVLSSSSDYAQFYNNATNEIEKFESRAEELTDALDDLQNTFSSIQSLAANFNEKGYYSTDDLQKLVELEPKYLNLLIDENGKINANSEAYKKYLAIKAKSLVLDRVKSLYETILQMSAEEAQAYANATAYEEEAKSLEDLISQTTKYYYTLAQAKDAENKTTVYTDSMKQSFKTVANYMSVYDSWLNSLNTSTNEFTNKTNGATSALEAQKSALESEKSALEDYKDGLEDAKDALEDYKDSLEGAQDDIQSLIDLTIDYIKQMKENEKDAINEQIDALDKQKDALDDQNDAYSDLISKKKEEIELLYEEKKAQDELSEKQKSAAKDALALAIAQLDDSSAGKKSQKQAADNYAESSKDLKDYLDEQEKDKRIAALEEEEAAYSEMIEKRKAAIDEQVEHLESKIDEIDDYLDNSRKLYEDACNMIDNDNGTLYSNLWNYTYTYTTQTRAEFDYLWSSAQAAIQRYKGDNDTLISTMEILQSKIYDTDRQIDDLNTQIDNCETQISNLDTAISNTSDAISNTSSSIDSVSSSLDGLGASIAAYMEQLNSLADINSKKTSFWVSYNGKKYTTGANYSGDTKNNRLLAAAELTKLIAKDVSGFDNYGLGIVQGLLGVGNGSAKGWYYNYNGSTYSWTSKNKDTAAKNIQSLIKDRTGKTVKLDTIKSGIKSYARGTRNSDSLAITQEDGFEAIFGKLSSGQYTMMPQGSQVFTAAQTDNLYGFASDPQKFISDVIGKMSGFLATSYGDFANKAKGVTNNVAKYGGDVTMNFAPVTNIQGNADKTTLSQMDKLYEKFKNRFMLEMLREKNNL